MPLCGFWGATVSSFWWVLPLIGLVVMAIMFFVCFRGMGCGCMGERRRSSGELSDLHLEVESMKDAIRRMSDSRIDGVGAHHAVAPAASGRRPQ